MTKKNPTERVIEQMLTDLAKLRKNGWSLEALAEKCGVGFATVQRWSCGDSKPSRALSIIAGPVLRNLAKKIR